MSVSTKETAAAERARWLFELARAIDEAQWIAWRMGASTGRNPAARELYMRLEAARLEVEQLRGRILVSRLEPQGCGSDPAAAWDRRRKPRPKA